MTTTRRLSLVLIAWGCGGTPETKEQPAMAEQHEDMPADAVMLSEEQFQAAEIRVEEVRMERVSNPGTGLEVPGQVEFDPRRVAFVSPRVGGRLERLHTLEGDRVGAGDVVAHIYTPAFLTAQTDFLQSLRRAKLLGNTPDSTGAWALVDAARRRLEAIGLARIDIDSLERSGQVVQEFPLRAPFAGSVLGVYLLPGAAVGANDSVIKLADLSVVDVIADIPEQALPVVRLNQRATIALAAYPELRFEGHVERLRDQVDPVTRTVRAAIHATNRGGRLRPGMFATVRLAVSLRDAIGTQSGSVLTVPASAVVTEGRTPAVFVETGPRMYQRRAVRIRSLEAPGSASPTSDRVVIEEGLAAGDRVVVRGAFTLKSEFAKASLGEHGH